MLNVKQETLKILEKSDYTTSEFRGCFDIAAKKDTILLIKTLLNVDSFQKEQAKNLKIVSNNLDAYPLLVGVHTRVEKLKDGIVFERYELPTVSLKTFEDLIYNSIFPKIYRDRGGLYVEIDSKILRERRKNKGLTQRELAEAVGINKKSIYEHEKKQLRMVLDIAERLERILDEKITKHAIVFKTYQAIGGPKNKMEKSVGKSLQKIGLETRFVGQAPLDVFAKKDALVISDIEPKTRRMMRRAVFLKDFIKVVNKPAVFITEKSKKDEVSGIPVIERKDLKDIESEKELLKIAKKSVD
jgi:putative transcriptional regulator